MTLRLKNLIPAACLTALFLVSWCAAAAPPSVIVVVFGDSITAGGALPADEREHLWLRAVERESQGSLTLVNEGKGGRPSASRDEFDQMLARQLRIDRLVIALGMNDSRDITEQCVPKAVANLRYMITQARKKHGADLPILLVGPSNINKSALGPTKSIADQREARLKELGAAFKKLAAEMDASYVSLFGVVPENSLLKDGVHPDAAGNEAIARVMKKAIAP